MMFLRHKAICAARRATLWNGGQSAVRIELHFTAVGLQGGFQHDIGLITDGYRGANIAAIRGKHGVGVEGDRTQPETQRPAVLYLAAIQFSERYPSTKDRPKVGNPGKQPLTQCQSIRARMAGGAACDRIGFPLRDLHQNGMGVPTAAIRFRCGVG